LRFSAKVTGAIADRPRVRELVAVLQACNVAITSAIDCSRDTADLLVIARAMRPRGAGIRSGQADPHPESAEGLVYQVSAASTAATSSKRSITSGSCAPAMA
jgi:hypothetical protein